MAKMFRLLRADEIECRVARCGLTDNDKKLGWVTVLLYKDARCDMNILDETVGAMNWQRRHSRENANCEVGIWSGSRGWIWKEDTGTESNTEAAKGLASDSFKRACVNWGIGRELYTAPNTLIAGIPLKENKRGTGYEPKGRFEVKEIAYDDSESICKLVITFTEGRKAPVEVFRWGFDPENNEEKDEDLERLKAAYPPEEEMRKFILENYDKDNLSKMLDYYGVKSIAELSYVQVVTAYNRKAGAK